MELEKVNTQFIIPSINSSHWGNFIACTKVDEKDLYDVQFKFYIKITNFVEIFIKFQGYVDEGNHF